MKWLHKLLKCFSFSAVLFTFEACYGDMEDNLLYDCEFSVHVVDSEGNGIPNVEVSMTNQKGSRVFIDTTSTAGMAYVKKGVLDISSLLELHLNPLEGVNFQPKDTSITSLHQQNYFTITLQSK